MPGRSGAEPVRWLVIHHNATSRDNKEVTIRRKGYTYIQTMGSRTESVEGRACKGRKNHRGSSVSAEGKRQLGLQPDKRWMPSD